MISGNLTMAMGDQHYQVNADFLLSSNWDYCFDICFSGKYSRIHS